MGRAVKHPLTADIRQLTWEKGKEKRWGDRGGGGKEREKTLWGLVTRCCAAVRAGGVFSCGGLPAIHSPQNIIIISELWTLLGSGRNSNRSTGRLYAIDISLTNLFISKLFLNNSVNKWMEASRWIYFLKFRAEIKEEIGNGFRIDRRLRGANLGVGISCCGHRSLPFAPFDVPFAPRRRRPDDGHHGMRLGPRLRPRPSLRPIGLPSLRRIREYGWRGCRAPSSRCFQSAPHYSARRDLHGVSGVGR